MKYKLINNKIKEEYLCNKVTIDGFDYYVVDEEPTLSDTLTTCYYIFKNSLYKREFSHHKGCRKVIATNNYNIDIPKVIDDVNEIKKNLYFYKQVMNPYETGDQSYTAYEKGFIEGYNKSQETHPFNEKDITDFAEWILKNCIQNGTYCFIYNTKNYSTKELFQIWKEQRVKMLYYE